MLNRVGLPDITVNCRATGISKELITTEDQV